MDATTGAPPAVLGVLDALQETFSSLQAVLGGLEPAEWELRTGCPGWSVHDVVSHVIGVERGTAGEPDPFHELPPREQLTHVKDDGSLEMERPVDLRRNRTPAQLLAELREVTRATMARRRASDRPADETTDGPFGWRMPYVQLLKIRVFDAFAHEQDVRRATGRPGNLGGKAMAITLELASAALPGGLPGRLPELADRPVAIRLEDGGGRQIVVGPTDRPPVAVLLLGNAELVPLVCGRSDARPGEVRVEGDVAYGREVAAHMGFTP